MIAASKVAARPDLAALTEYHSPRVDVAVRLNVNESPYPPPVAWQQALAAEVSRIDFNRYPDRGAHELREAIAALHGVAPGQVLVGKGSNELLAAICGVYGGPGRTAAVFEPTYALHSHIPRLWGTTVATGTRTSDFVLDPVEVRRVLDEYEPDITFLCSPNNPTGRIDPPELITEVSDTAPGVVVADEAYAQFAEWSALSLVDDSRALVVTRTFSKTWAMAGCRLGYLVGPAEMVAAAESLLLPYHLDVLTQAAGVLALRFQDEMADRVAAIVAGRERLVAGLATLEVDWWPSAANFVLFRPRHHGGRAVWKALVEQSVLVRDCSTWPGLTDCLRVTVGTPTENDAFLDALEVALS